MAKAAGAVETYTTGIGRFAALVDGRHAYSLADVRAVIGSKTFALYAGLFANANKGDVSLFDYLMLHLGSIRVSDRVPDVAASAQKGIAVLTASAEMPKIFTCGTRCRSSAIRTAARVRGRSPSPLRRSSRPLYLAAWHKSQAKESSPEVVVMNLQRVVAISVEVREAGADGPMLLATIVQEGRAAGGGRAELFIPLSVIWPVNGIAIRTQHRGPEVGRAIPSRETNGEIRISAKATPEIRKAFDVEAVYELSSSGALAETRTSAGIREISLAYVDGASLTGDPEYTQAIAEIRSRGRRVWL